MKIIAIDSSGLVASVAVVEEENLIAEYNVQYKKTHSQTLLPMLDEIKRMIDLDLATVDAVAISKGPGSFTGLRIGSATAKGLAQALNIPIIEISSLEGMATNLYGSDAVICPMMDARRNQVYAGAYIYEKSENGYEIKTVLEETADDVASVIGQISDIATKLNKNVIYLGDGVPVYLEQIKAETGVDYSLAPAHMNRQRAASFGYLAMSYLKEGRTVSYFDHAPSYLRLSQAERERNEGIRNKGSNY